MYYHGTQVVYVPHLLPFDFSLATLLLGEKLGAFGGGGEASHLPPLPHR